MFKKIKLHLYHFIVERLLEDEVRISRLFNKLRDEEKFRADLKEAAKQTRFDAIARARDEEFTREKKERQDKCPHTKGGRPRGSSYTDYAIWDHTFPDGRTVRCLICSKEWKGEELKSEEVLRMLNMTTNTRTATEFQVGPPRTEIQRAIFIDNLQKIKDHDKDGNFSVEEPYAPFMSLKHWNKLDKIYKRLTKKKKAV